ncbi:MAG TPA: UpxY family transcription antiterminator [Candidatus Barnesiella merdipullorum]|nr:UpxY family transcription antiterminator [Candidatus Barnesiella merdipullorum]
MPEIEEEGWYVAKTYRQERKIKELLTRMGVKHFVPFHETIKEIGGKRKKVEVPFISGLIFVHGRKKECISLINDYGYPMRYVRDFSSRSLLRVPGKQMEDFIYLVEQHENEIEILPHDLRRGDRVRVVAGSFAGIEGELVRIAGHRRVVVRLDNLFTIATVYIPGSYLEKICD